MRLPPEIHSIILGYVLDMRAYDLFIRFKSFLRYNRCVNVLRCLNTCVHEHTGEFNIQFVMGVIKYLKQNMAF